MTKTLYVQTDTTDAWNFRESIADKSQPHLVRLAWIVANDGEPTQTWCKLIKPRNDWVYNPDATVLHGITREKAQSAGVPLNFAMAALVGVLDSVHRVCAFNAQFHTQVLQHAAVECGLNGEHLFREHTIACAMRRATDIVRKPRMAPGGGYQWPRFTEAYGFFGGEELPSLDMDPIDRGIALVNCVRVIDQGILAHERSTPHE